MAAAGVGLELRLHLPDVLVHFGVGVQVLDGGQVIFGVMGVASQLLVLMLQNFIIGLLQLELLGLPPLQPGVLPPLQQHLVGQHHQHGACGHRHAAQGHGGLLPPLRHLPSHPNRGPGDAHHHHTGQDTQGQGKEAAFFGQGDEVGRHQGAKEIARKGHGGLHLFRTGFQGVGVIVVSLIEPNIGLIGGNGSCRPKCCEQNGVYGRRPHFDVEPRQSQHQQDQGIADHPRLPQGLQQDHQPILPQKGRQGQQQHPPVGQSLLGHPGEEQIGDHQLQGSQHRDGVKMPRQNGLQSRDPHIYLLLRYSNQYL